MRNFILLSTLVIGLAGCSGSRPTTVDNGGQREPTFDDILRELPASETFDETAYPASMPVMDVEVDHDVPAELMDGSAGASSGGQQSGYRIQVAFAREKVAADQAVDEIHTWLRQMRVQNPQIPAFQQNLPVHNIYLQPYFRVRIGDFSSREKAEELLDQMLEEYPRAFIVVDQVDR